MEPRNGKLAHQLVATFLLSSVAATLGLGQALIVRNCRMLDGRPTMSLADVVLDFTGGAKSLLEARSADDMRQYLSGEELARLVVWSRTGASEEAYRKEVANILDDRCVGCHNPEGVAAFRPLDSYELAAAAARAPPAPAFSHQLLVTKIHLFGIGVLVAVPARLAARAPLSGGVVATLVALAYFGLFLDFGSWWAMRLTTAAAAGRALGNIALSVSFLALTVIGLWAVWSPADDGVARRIHE